jgi:co-chaperonin GroES (HSP10)
MTALRLISRLVPAAKPAPALEGLLPAAEDIRTALEPCGYKILVFMVKLEEQTKSGIYRPDDSRALMDIASPVAQVVAMGPLAYQDRKRFPDGKPWCQPQDYILMRPYSGTRFVREDHSVIPSRRYEYRLINDDTVEGVIHCDPNEIMRPEAV